ncbi:hypothetical protein C0Q70_20785 [Pomacea canaliculata]|uniref:Uncharacterized protein n=1 Tax=Pomacea canaliculata TaxID=400727 RepID=A0A2T7NGJ9_POMCA|nr:hypothetical protein C0Q70_20785 [Pomacea canaliculata]
MWNMFLYVEDKLLSQTLCACVCDRKRWVTALTGAAQCPEVTDAESWWSLTCSSPDNSRQMAVLLVLLLSMVGGLDAVSLRPSAFLKLPDKIGSLRFGVGSASHAAFDEERSILYVVGM